MEQYKIIKTKEQYKAYCDRVMELAALKPTDELEDEIETIEIFIDKWENEQYKKNAIDPVQLLKYLMENRNMNQEQLATALSINKSYVSLILNYKKGLSKVVIRKLAELFKVSQEAFNRTYELVSPLNRGHKHEKLMNVKKGLAAA